MYTHTHTHMYIHIYIYIYIQICEHVYVCNILAEEHFDFRTKSSTNNAIYDVTNGTLNDSNNELNVGSHFVNLKRF
jgi:hypothetical protein